MMRSTCFGATTVLALITFLAAASIGPSQSAAKSIGAVPAIAMGSTHGMAVLVTQPVNDMPPGMRAAYIDSLHEELVAHGYDPGADTGLVGPRFVHAVRDYQRDAALPITGFLTKALLDHLKFAQPRIQRAAALSSNAPSHSDRVQLTMSIQQELAVRGYYDYKVDGIAGPITRAAIRKFQGDAGLPVDGILDPALLIEMRDDYPYVRAN